MRHFIGPYAKQMNRAYNAMPIADFLAADISRRDLVLLFTGALLPLDVALHDARQLADQCVSLIFSQTR